MTRQKPKIVIYSDQAAKTSTADLEPFLRQSFPDYDVVTAPTEAYKQALRDGSADIAVLPGICNEECAYYDLLDTQLFKDYVENGGVLLTVCAGSYFISAHTEYIPPWGPKKERSNLSALFNATARGPLNGLGAEPAGENWYDGYSVVPISYTNKEGEEIDAHIAYGNGPALVLEDPAADIEVLARYKQLDDEPIAAAFARRGKGAVLWLGVLPHTGYHEISKDLVDPKIWELMESLKPYEEERKTFWNHLMNRLKDHIQQSSRPESGPSLDF